MISAATTFSSEQQEDAVDTQTVLLFTVRLTIFLFFLMCS